MYQWYTVKHSVWLNILIQKLFWFLHTLHRWSHYIKFSQYNQILSFSINLGFYLDPGVLFLPGRTFLTAELLWVLQNYVRLSVHHVVFIVLLKEVTAVEGCLQNWLSAACLNCLRSTRLLEWLPSSDEGNFLLRARVCVSVWWKLIFKLSKWS